LDFSSLELKEALSWRMPQPLLVRQEYKFLSNLLSMDSVILSSQPGTGEVCPFFHTKSYLISKSGKTGYLFQRMVDSMIDHCPFLYQSVDGIVYHVSDTVIEVNTWASKETIVAFVDADETLVEPKGFIHQLSVQIIAASSPRGTRQLWLKQMGNSPTPLKLVTALWSPSELFLTRFVTALWFRVQGTVLIFLFRLFLNPYDLTYSCLKESTSYFRLNPRLCFNASIGDKTFCQFMLDIKDRIISVSQKRCIRSLFSLLLKSRLLSHTIFELSPANEDCLFGEALVRAVSLWALNLVLEPCEAHWSGAAAIFHQFS
jgi:hypothetical protein